MAPDITPDSLRQSEFRSSFRGLDPAEVRARLEAAARKLEQLDAERRKLVARLEESPSSTRNLQEEFDQIGNEVSAILQTAREAADSMRERASLDSARWRSEAMEEAETTRREAAADAEALRRDAWVTGSELLEQSGARAEQMRADAERDVLTVMGEAEREAHRLTSGARREAEDLIRNATMDAEKVTSDATKRRDEIIDAANRQASAAQERTRALEQRRDELLVELENVRSTLTRLEGSLEERREALDLTSAEPSSVRVVHPPAETKKQWELGETVRVVAPEQGAPPDEQLATEVSEEVARTQETMVEEPGSPERVPEAEEPADSVEPEVEPDAIEEPDVADDQPEPDDLSALFASLRETGESEPSEPSEAESRDDEPDGDEPEEQGIDWIEIREERLLPISNRALRGVKKAMTEVQNAALDGLRTDEGWEPDTETIAEALHAELVAVWSESFAAGHSVAEQMTGSKLKRPATPASQADKAFASDLVVAVSKALDEAGDGTRERQSAASRVFRVWRSDEAERRIRTLALEAYDMGIEESRRVVTG